MTATLTARTCAFIAHQTIKRIFGQLVNERISTKAMAWAVTIVLVIILSMMSVAAWQVGKNAQAAGMELLVSYLGAALFGTTAVSGFLLQLSLFPEQISKLRRDMLVLPISRAALRIGSLIPVLFAPGLIAVLGILPVMVYSIAVRGLPPGTAAVLLLGASLPAGSFALWMTGCIVLSSKTRGSLTLTSNQWRLVALGSVLITAVMFVMPIYTVLVANPNRALTSFAAFLPMNWLLHQEVPMDAGASILVAGIAASTIMAALLLSRWYTLSNAASPISSTRQRSAATSTRNIAGTACRHSGVPSTSTIGWMSVLVHRNSPHVVDTLLYALLGLSASLVAVRMIEYGLTKEPYWAVTIAGYSASLAALGVIPASSPWRTHTGFGLSKNRLIFYSIAISALWTCLAVVPSILALYVAGVPRHLWLQLGISLLAGVLSSMISGLLFGTSGASPLGRLAMMCCSTLIFFIVAVIELGLNNTGFPTYLTAAVLVAATLALPSISAQRQKGRTNHI